MKLYIAKCLGRWLESATGTRCIGFTNNLKWKSGHTIVIGLFPYLTFTPNSQVELRRQGVNYRYTNTVETAGHLIVAVVELSARVQDRHNDFCC